MIELKIGVFTPVTELGEEVKSAPTYGGIDIRSIEQEPNLDLHGPHYNRHKDGPLHYEPKTTFLLKKYLPFLNRYHRISVDNILIDHVSSCDIIVIEYTQIKYLTIEHCKALQGSVVLFDDVDEAYDVEVTLKEFKEVLNDKGIETNNFTTIRNQDINYWYLNSVLLTSNIQYLGTDDFKKIYTDSHIKRQFSEQKTKNFIACLGSPHQQYRMDFLNYCIDNNIDDNYISIGYAPMLTKLRNIDHIKDLSEKYVIEDYKNEYYFNSNRWKTTVYRNSYFTVVPETAYEGKKDCTFDYLVTEKTYTPMLYGHPFIQFAPVGNCDYLKGLGFEMFEELHEPYDNQFDSICSSILNFDSNNISDTTLDKCLHNSNNLYNIDNILQEWEDFLQKFLT